MERAVSETADERALLPHGIGRAATSWSRDGRFLIYHEYDSKGGWDLWVLPMQGERKPVPLLQTEFSERQGQLSPDGRLLAYTSDESGERQVYVRAFRISAAGGPSLEAKWAVSSDGGHSPRWRPDGRELFYIGEDRKLKAVEVKAGAGFEAGPPRPLFEMNNYVTSANWVYRYDVSPDGQRFLAVGITESAEPSPITVVLNWASGLKGR